MNLTPSPPPSDPVTRLLRARAAGEAGAESALLSLIYDELRQLARRQLAGERGGHTLTPTALVHEAWLRLSARQDADSRDRAQFYALAARRMRQVLIDYARQHKAEKRGGGVSPVTLSAADAVAGDSEVDALALGQALQQLECHDARKAQVVELRYFGGLEMAEIAELLGVSRATVQRDWEVARAFLHLRLG